MKEEEIRKREIFNKYLELVAKDVKAYFKHNEFSEIACPACGGDNFSKEFTKINFDYVTCQNCGTLFVNPRPSISSLKRFYSVSASSEYWVNDFFKPVADVRREKIFRPRAEYIIKSMPAFSKQVIGDIGAGFGIFLEELEKKAPDNNYVAVEPSVEMAKICQSKGFDVIPDFFENIEESRNNTFFLLTAFEILEHAGDPQELLKKVYNALIPGGRLLFTTLNGEGFDTQILWEKSKSIFPPHHLNFFNPDSIRIILDNIGFDTVEISTPGVLDWDILEGAYKEEGLEIGRFWKLVCAKASQEVKQSLQSWISSSGFSSHMRVLAKKPLS